jgi:hypothetical protein
MIEIFDGYSTQFQTRLDKRTFYDPGVDLLNHDLDETIGCKIERWDLNLSGYFFFNMLTSYSKSL